MRNALAIFVICILIGVGAGTVACLSTVKEINQSVQTATQNSNDILNEQDSSSSTATKEDKTEALALEEEDSNNPTPPLIIEDSPTESSADTEEPSARELLERYDRRDFIMWAFDNTVWRSSVPEKQVGLSYYFYSGGNVTIHLCQQVSVDDKGGIVLRSGTIYGKYRIDPSDNKNIMIHREAYQGKDIDFKNLFDQTNIYEFEYDKYSKTMTFKNPLISYTETLKYTGKIFKEENTGD